MIVPALLMARASVSTEPGGSNVMYVASRALAGMAKVVAQSAKQSVCREYLPAAFKNAGVCLGFGCMILFSSSWNLPCCSVLRLAFIQFPLQACEVWVVGSQECC